VTLQQRFDRFDAANPQVWEAFQRYTFELLRAGRTAYSSDAILHRIRWDSAIQTSGTPFKISNNHSAYYARKFHAAFPQHDGFFRTNELREHALPLQEAA
jgi:hypothetical protein